MGAASYQGIYPAALKCLTADRADLTASLRFPPSSITEFGTPAPRQGPRSAPRRDQLPHPGVGVLDSASRGWLP
jgi:hypothetical protein